MQPTKTKYHFRLFFLQRKEAFPPAHSSASCFYEITADFMKSLLLFGGPRKEFSFINFPEKEILLWLPLNSRFSCLSTVRC